MNKKVTVHNADVVSLLSSAYTSRVHNPKESVVLAKQALAISKKAGDLSLIGKSLNQLSLFYMILGEYKLSVNTAKEAIRYFQKLNDERGIADAQYNIASVYYKTDNYHLGLINLIDSLAIYRKFDDYHNQARTHKSLGTIYEYFGDRKNAVRSYEASIDAAKKVKDQDLVANAYNPLSGICLKKGKIPKAWDMIQKSVAIKTKSGDVRGLAFSLYGRGKVHVALERWAEAEQDFQRAMEIHKEMGERLGLGMVYCKLGSLYVKTNQLNKAKHVLEKALQFSTSHNIIYIKFKSNYQLYRVYKAENNTLKSLEYLEHYLNEKETVINTQTLKIIENYELITKMETLEKAAQLEKERIHIMENQARAEHTARVKQNFLSTMSHEIRTPLNAVITITSLLNERVDPEEKQLLDSLKFASNNLLMIINDILDFTKLDTGRVQLECRNCNLLALFKSISETYNNMAKAKGLLAEIKIDENIPGDYEVDETKLSQILNNLISNAIKFTDRGKVTVGLKLINSIGDHDTLRFTITDTGVGIPEDFFDEMFDSFSQPKAITTRKQGGSGLGLAIVKKLVELHQSQIHFKSIIGQGSEFYFDIKFKKATPVKKAVVQDLDQLRNKIVLLADDNMINAMVARKLLSKWGVSAEHAVNGLDAIEKAKQQQFDFILMDIHMPEMNGFDATMHIRKNQNLNVSTPIFALTADVTAENHAEYIGFFTGFLRKPIEIDKLYEALLNVSARVNTSFR
ncbi:tetratricopeptide repeat protein [Mucilaginibacter galii]|uniref:histidine kinase n=1 Tax=Mucilaginibacter galii TaxID=2005073 RepID=A0A917J5X2_9SPHI|nr:tetratricopeptide repeat protein [Mucilaginibacter galii]GGI49096.1 histidine kinase [Mucilaginibacter galii]